MVRYVKMEKTELADNQIFNIIEEIQDIIDTTEISGEPQDDDMEIVQSTHH